jgi:hypothetical protein
MDAQLRAAIRPVLSRYPRGLVVSSVRGVVKSTVSHNMGPLASMTGTRWVAPGTGSLLRADPDALGRLAHNGAILATGFVWELAHTVFAWVLAFVGLVLALRSSAWRPFGLVLLAVLLYFHLTVAVVGAEAFYRSRTPHVPYVFALAGLALANVGRRSVQRERESGPGEGHA